MAKAAGAAIERIETWGVWSNAIETFFRGISLSSILLIMSLGLAIVFGLMGVIKHGPWRADDGRRLCDTFMSRSNASLAWFSSDVVDWYFPAAALAGFPSSWPPSSDGVLEADSASGFSTDVRSKPCWRLGG